MNWALLYRNTVIATTKPEGVPALVELHDYLAQHPTIDQHYKDGLWITMEVTPGIYPMWAETTVTVPTPTVKPKKGKKR